MKDLIVRVGPTEYTFGPDATVRLGRNPGSEVVITNSNVSREHAVISNDSGIWQLIDAGSSQGTWRDGQRVDQVELRGTVHVTLGLEDRGTPVVIEAPTGANEELLRPGGPMADSELGESTEVVGAQRGPRGRMDQTVIVNDSEPIEGLEPAPVSWPPPVPQDRYQDGGDQYLVGEGHTDEDRWTAGGAGESSRPATQTQKWKLVALLLVLGAMAVMTAVVLVAALFLARS
ncbi:MAG: FHA domain-containing protein [Microthrixaceae bacterium]